MANVLVPLAHGFEEIEAVTIIDVLRRADIGVTVAGLTEGAIIGAHGVAIVPDVLLSTVSTESFDMIVLPGGQPGTDNLGKEQKVHQLLGEFAAEGKFICAICAAPIVLGAAGLLQGKKATCYPAYRDHLKGGNYLETPVVVDHRLITGSGPAAAMRFGLELVAQLVRQQVADDVAQALLVP